MTKNITLDANDPDVQAFVREYAGERTSYGDAGKVADMINAQIQPEQPLFMSAIVEVGGFNYTRLCYGTGPSTADRKHWIHSGSGDFARTPVSWNELIARGKVRVRFPGWSGAPVEDVLDKPTPAY